MIEFPDFIELDNIEKSGERYEGANIERLELEAMIQGMNELLRLSNIYENEFKNVNTVIFTTDRYALSDKERTNPYRIREYRKNGWKNHEEKPIKNKDLLDKIDKTRKRVTGKLRCSLEIQFIPRKQNRIADRLSKESKKKNIVNKTIKTHGQKIGRRKYTDGEILYNNLSEKEKLIVHIFKKEPINDQWEISAELCDGNLVGKKIKIYTDFPTEKKLHRHHIYIIKIKKIFSHHIVIYKTIKEKKVLRGA